MDSFSQFALLAAAHAFNLARHPPRAGGWLAGFKRLLRALSGSLGLVVLEILPWKLRHAGSIHCDRLGAAVGVGLCGRVALDCIGICPRNISDRFPLEFRGRIAIPNTFPDSNRRCYGHIWRDFFGGVDVRLLMRDSPDSGASALYANSLGRRRTAFARCGGRGKFWTGQNPHDSNAAQGIDRGHDSAKHSSDLDLGSGG